MYCVGESQKRRLDTSVASNASSMSVCRLGHPNKGRMRMLTKSLHVAQKVNRRCPSRQQHPVREADMKIQDGPGWAGVFARQSMQSQKIKYAKTQDKTTAYMKWDEFYGETTDEQFDKEKVAEASREEMKYFEATGKKVPNAQAVNELDEDPKASRVDVKNADGRHRSRLVTKEFYIGNDETMYAATPPLEALELLTVKLAARARTKGYKCCAS